MFKELNINLATMPFEPKTEIFYSIKSILYFLNY